MEKRLGLHKRHYRSDIDGLRAVAVVSVVLFHLDYLKGGFVGVDIFFVISGFLITSILVAELDLGTFSLGGFYERRIRRIVPALFVVFAASTFLGYMYLLPGEFTQFAQSLLAALLSVSNLFFWKQSGYFDALSSTKPLRHTWSLAVEEQFYLLFPLLLAFLYRVARTKVRSVLVILTLASFALNILLTRRFPDFAFYWPLTRAWELSIGSLLVLIDVPVLKHSIVRNLAAGFGLLLTLFVLFHYTSRTPFPGIAASLPCLGAALIIAAGVHGSTFVGRALSVKPVLYIGLISYSLYLWHWPIIVFAAHGMPITQGLPRRPGKAVIFGLSLVAGLLSWRYVERPFRRARPGSVRRHVFISAGIGAGLIAVTGIVIAFAGGFPSRYSPEARKIAAYPELTLASTHAEWRLGTCFISSAFTYTDFNPGACLAKESGRENDLLMGDSHAAHLFHGLSQAFPEIHFLQATASGCKPTIRSGDNESAICRTLVEWVLRSYLPANHVDRVILSARWSTDDLDRLGETISYLKSIGLDPVVIGPMVEYDSALPSLLAMSLRSYDPGLPEAHRLESLRLLDRTMSSMANERWHTRYLSYYPYLCSGKECKVLLPGDVPMEDDADHLSSPGSIYVAEAWRRAGVFPEKSPVTSAGR